MCTHIAAAFLGKDTFAKAFFTVNAIQMFSPVFTFTVKY